MDVSWQNDHCQGGREPADDFECSPNRCGKYGSSSGWSFLRSRQAPERRSTLVVGRPLMCALQLIGLGVGL